jgi:tetratricopeptide (TPR) repeat protein
LKPFNAFTSFVSQYTHQDNPDYANIREYKIDDMKISLLGLNSAWMCGRRKNPNGEIDDKGVTIIGEPQIHDPLEAISTSDIKIAVMHHPFEFLADFECSQIEKSLRSGCNFILRGHQHNPKVEVAHSTDGDSTVIPAGACYDRRTYANAYNFVHLDFKSGRGVVFLRCWNGKDKWREDVDSSAGGKYEFFISKSILENLQWNDSSQKSAKGTPIDLRSKEIIPSHTSHQKKIGDLFKNNDRTSTNDSTYIIGRGNQINDFSELLSNFYHAQAISDNVLLICIWGFGGVGKTTLLKKFGEICDSDKWLITGMSENNSTIQTPHPAEPLSVFLSRIRRFENKPGASEFETISKFVLSLPSRSALLVDEFRSEEKDFVNSFEWMINQMTNQANHRYLIITACRPRPRFHRVQVDHYVGTKKGLPPLTLEDTREYLDFYWKDDPRNKNINEIFDVTKGNPKVLNYLYASSEISQKILSRSDTSALDEADVIFATWEYVHNHEDFRRVADLAAVMGMVSIACPNDIFDLMIENWYELRKAMLDQSLLEQVEPNTYKIHDLLRDFHYKNMHGAVKQQQHRIVGNYYETIKNYPVLALEHYVRAEYKEGIQKVYRAAYKVMERNSDYKSIIRLVGMYIDTSGAKDEFDIDVITDRGMSYRILTEYRSALSEFDRALSLCNKLVIPENSLKRAKILWGLGETYRRLDRYKESLEYYDKGILIYRTYENDDGKDGIARSERGKSAVYKMISRYHKSLQGYEVASDIYASMGYLDGQLYCERGLAAVHMLQGLYIQAQKEYAHSLQLYKETKNPRGIAYACWGYAESFRLQNEIEAAIEKYIEALELSRKIGDDWSVTYLSLNLAECFRAERDFDKAREWYNRIMKLETYQNSPVLQAHYVLATAELQRLEKKTGSELYRQAEKMYQEIPMGLLWGIANSRIGLCLAELRTLKDENDSQWKECMDSIIDYCDQNQLPNEFQTAKRIIEEKDPDELHPLSFP